MNKRPSMLLPMTLSSKYAISLVDGLEQAAKAGGLLNRPQAIKRGPEQANVILRQQADSYDTLLLHVHLDSPD
jgi:hypothetical protein